MNLLVSRDFEPTALNAQGQAPTNDSPAISFSFSFKGNTDKDYGTVVILLGNDSTQGEQTLTVFFGDNIGRTMDDLSDKNSWFSFLEQMKNFAVRNGYSFTTDNINKVKYSMQGQTAIKEGLLEGWTGNKAYSWNGVETEARLMIKHKRVIGENDARFRYVESLFVETAEGERYKLPFTKLAGGRAMVEHVRQGGKPYDARGNHIATVVQEMNLLSRFKRANQGKIFEGDTLQLVEQAEMYYERLQQNLKKLSTKTGYASYFESWDPAVITDEDVIIEDLRHMFVEQNIDSRVEQVLPLLAKLQQEQKMKEVNVFENWANLIFEGTWALPDTKEKQSKLVELMSQELPVGPDATNTIEQLDSLLGDDELFDRLKNLADENADADARQIILDRLEELKDNPDVAQVIGQLTTPSSNQAEQDNVNEINRLSREPVKENRQQEGEYEFSTTITNPAWIEWENSAEDPLPDEPEETIPVTVTFNTEGEYHAATWGDAGGSPAEGIVYEIVTVRNDQTREYIDLDLVDIPYLEEKAQQFYEANMEESVGGGNWLEESNQDEKSKLAGKYGHSGKMKAVEGVDADMMERIKFLAGLTK